MPKRTMTPREAIDTAPAGPGSLRMRAANHLRKTHPDQFTLRQALDAVNASMVNDRQSRP